SYTSWAFIAESCSDSHISRISWVNSLTFSSTFSIWLLTNSRAPRKRAMPAASGLKQALRAEPKTGEDAPILLISSFISRPFVLKPSMPSPPFLVPSLTLFMASPTLLASLTSKPIFTMICSSLVISVSSSGTLAKKRAVSRSGQGNTHGSANWFVQLEQLLIGRTQHGLRRHAVFRAECSHEADDRRVVRLGFSAVGRTRR